MYPGLLISQEFPVSRAKTLIMPTVEQVVDRDNHLLYGGVISALILPDREQSIVGLLPVRLRRAGERADKIFYPTCAACAQEGLHGVDRLTPCDHPSKLRALRGCWTTVELAFALKHKYRMLACYQVSTIHKPYPSILGTNIYAVTLPTGHILRELRQ
jgi:hypothetical protein